MVLVFSRKAGKPSEAFMRQCTTKGSPNGTVSLSIVLPKISQTFCLNADRWRNLHEIQDLSLVQSPGHIDIGTPWREHPSMGCWVWQQMPRRRRSNWPSSDAPCRSIRTKAGGAEKWHVSMCEKPVQSPSLTLKWGCKLARKLLWKGAGECLSRRHRISCGLGLASSRRSRVNCRIVGEDSLCYLGGLRLVYGQHLPYRLPTTINLIGVIESTKDFTLQKPGQPFVPWSWKSRVYLG